MSMNKTIGWVIVAVVVIGGLWYLSSHSPQTSTISEEVGGDVSTTIDATSTTRGTAGGVNVTNTTNKVFRSSIQGLLKRAGNYRCTFTRSDSSAKTDGTMYISGNRLRGDFVSTVAGGLTVQSHMLYLADYVYTWSSLTSQGFKSKATILNSGGAVSPTNSGGFDYSQTVDYDCQTWGGDAALFEFPKGITFSNT